MPRLPHGAEGSSGGRGGRERASELRHGLRGVRCRDDRPIPPTRRSADLLPPLFRGARPGSRLLIGMTAAAVNRTPGA